ncbi:MAG: hypothetical protein IJD88_05445, partial [Clostridia bacterium]|nr:hypothetical protein [Clostridia bacterium]
MKTTKKILSFALALIMCFTIIPIMDLDIGVYAKSYITSSSSANGSNYTSSSSLASKLNTVFSGDIDIYSNSACTNEVSMPLG